MTKHETIVPAAEAAGVTLIPLNRLKKSLKNVRRVAHSETSINALAASIAAVGILQNLVVEPELAEDGTPTGDYLVTAGEGRRLAQLLRAKRKDIRKTEPLPCRIEANGNAREISLHENANREQMHPADQFEAFRDLVETDGQTIDDVAARFGVTPTVVKQRLKLATVSPKLLQIYREGGLNLEQMMAFAVSDSHERQDAVFAQLGTWNNDAGTIRRRLTQDYVRSDDRLAVFVGEEAYRAAGGVVDKDLFDVVDGGGYFQNVMLLDDLAHQKLEALAAQIKDGEGWKWSAAQFDFPHRLGMGRVHPRDRELDEADAQAQAYQSASDEYEAILATVGDKLDFAPAVDERVKALVEIIDALDTKKRSYEPADLVRAGVLATLDYDGEVRITRGLVRVEDEAPAGTDAEAHAADGEGEGDPDNAEAGADDEDEDVSLSLSDALTRDMTTHRTLALRHELSLRSSLALIVMTHTLAAKTFYRFTDVSCLDVVATSSPAVPTNGLDANPASAALEACHAQWAARVPANPAELWAFVAALSGGDLLDLFAYCTAITLDATKYPHLSRIKGADTIDAVAADVKLDMADYWKPTAGTFFARVTRGQILDIVGNAVGEEAARRMKDMKKPTMVEEAERLMSESRWLPDLLRTKPTAKAENLAVDGQNAVEPGADALAAE